VHVFLRPAWRYLPSRSAQPLLAVSCLRQTAVKNLCYCGARVRCTRASGSCVGTSRLWPSKPPSSWVRWRNEHHIGAADPCRPGEQWLQGRLSVVESSARPAVPPADPTRLPPARPEVLGKRGVAGSFQPCRLTFPDVGCLQPDQMERYAAITQPGSARWANCRCAERSVSFLMLSPAGITISFSSSSPRHQLQVALRPKRRLSLVQARQAFRGPGFGSIVQTRKGAPSAA
jgi:hypothetical protein